MKQKTKNKLQRGVATGLLIPALGVVSAPKVAAVTAVLAYVITIVSCPNGTTAKEEHTTWNGISVSYMSDNVAGWDNIRGLIDVWWSGLDPDTEQVKFTTAITKINITSGNAVTRPGGGSTLNIGGQATGAQLGPVMEPIIACLQLDNGMRLAFAESAKETVRASFGRVRGA